MDPPISRWFFSGIDEIELFPTFAGAALATSLSIVDGFRSLPSYRAMS